MHKFIFTVTPWLFGALMFAGLASMPHAHADTLTVDGVGYPACALEDGSDAASLPCVWTDPDTGDQWLTFADYSLPPV